MSDTQNKKDNLKFAMCYVPFVAIFLYFVEENKTKELKKHINYWIILFVGLIIINVVLKALFLTFFAWLATLAYIIISAILWYKAFVWENVDIEILENIEKKVDSKLNPKDDRDVLNDKDLF